MDIPRELQEHVARLSDRLATESSDLARLQATAGIIQHAIPGCDSASIALLVEEVALTGVSTSRLALEADLVQYHHDEGPCLTAARRCSPVRIDVLGGDDRFHHFAPGALDLGVESVLSLPLVAGEMAVGSVNLYSETAHAFAHTALEPLAPMLQYAAEVISGSPLYDASVDVLERLVDVVEETTVVDLAISRLVRVLDLDSAAAWHHLNAAAAVDGSLVASARRVIATVHADP